MKKIYLVGIKGVGMASLAVYLKERGHEILGSDTSEIFPTDIILSQNKIRVVEGFKKENISRDIDLVITTAAHSGLKNIEADTAIKMGIPVYSYAKEIGHLMNSYKTKIAVCGTHGKTTSAALTAFLFNKLKLPSSHIVGAANFSGLYGGHYGGTDYLVVEADEYVTSLGSDNTPKFMHLNPNYIICTNIDFDHVDVFGSLDDVKNVFYQFFKQSIDKNNSKIIYCFDDLILREVVSSLAKQNLFSYGLNKEADLHLDNYYYDNNPKRIYFQLEDKQSNKKTSFINLWSTGKQNLVNGIGVLSLFKLLGDDIFDQCCNLSGSFSGVSRRFEKIFEDDDTYLYDDYGHHPTEIRALIDSVKSQYPDKRIVVIFQPHTYSRTLQFKDEFIESLSKTDVSFILDIFGSAREKSQDQKIDSEKIVLQARNNGYKNIFYLKSEQIRDIMKDTIKKGDLVLTIGAGDVYKCHSDIIEVIKMLNVRC